MTRERRRVASFQTRILCLAGLVVAASLLFGCGLRDGSVAHSCKSVAYQSNEAPVPALLCRPDGPQSEHPAVIYLHAVGGPGEVPEGIFRRLTAAGFVVLAPFYFAQTPAPGPDPRSFAHAYATGADADYAAAARQWPRIIADGVTFLQTQPGVAADRIGVTGYSLGGALALKVAAADARLRAAAPVAAFVELAGFPHLSGFFGENLPDHAAHLPPLLLLHGSRDHHAPVAQSHAIAALAEAAGRPVQVTTYDGDHFLRGKQNDWASQRIVEFFRSHLEAVQILR